MALSMGDAKHVQAWTVGGVPGAGIEVPSWARSDTARADARSSGELEQIYVLEGAFYDQDAGTVAPRLWLVPSPPDHACDLGCTEKSLTRTRWQRQP